MSSPLEAINFYESEFRVRGEDNLPADPIPNDTVSSIIFQNEDTLEASMTEVGLPEARSRLPAVHAPENERPPMMRGASSKAAFRGSYLVKFSVYSAACFLSVKMLASFSEVLLPFIFAVLCVLILDPFKKFVMRILQGMTAMIFGNFPGESCFERQRRGRTEQESAEVEANSFLYGTVGEDSASDTAAAAVALVPTPAFKRLLLGFSIVFCLIFTGRVLWLIGEVFYSAGMEISTNLVFYQQGYDRLQKLLRRYIRAFRLEGPAEGNNLTENEQELIKGLVEDFEKLGSTVTRNVFSTVLQSTVTLIFVIYMLWSPVRIDGNAMRSEAYKTTVRYLKVKFLVSVILAFVIFFLLSTIGLQMPAAFALLAFLANFLPGVGSLASSFLPCILGAIDVRISPTQVLLAFVAQMAVHFCFDFLIEPVFFGISVEIHSVIVILGIYFFYQIWGVPGMLLSVPLLAVFRITMRSMRDTGQGGHDGDAVALMNNMLEGRWMASNGRIEDEQGHRWESYPQTMHPVSTELTGHLVSEAPGPATQAWDAVVQNAACWFALHFYEAHSLLVDGTCLLAVTVIIFML